jgi:hypothetical protein
MQASSEPKIRKESGGVEKEPKLKKVRLTKEKDLSKPKPITKGDLEKQIITLTMENSMLKNQNEELKLRASALEKQVQNERTKYENHLLLTEKRSQSFVEGATQVMAKSHESAMRTLQVSQRIIASSLGASLSKLRSSNSSIKMLLPPTLTEMKSIPDKALYHTQVAKYLNSVVKDFPTGTTLLEKIDKAIKEAEATHLEELEKMKSETLSKEEGVELKLNSEELQGQLEGLKYQRLMLFKGLFVTMVQTCLSNKNPEEKKKLIVILDQAITEAERTLSCTDNLNDTKEVEMYLASLKQNRSLLV